MSILSWFKQEEPVPAVPAVKTKEKPHDHQWQLIAKTYAPPRIDIAIKLENPDEKIMFGVTSFLWECVLCMETKKEFITGSETTTLEEELDKVLLYGPQYLDVNGTIFEIKKWQPPTMQPGMVPIR